MKYLLLFIALVGCNNEVYVSGDIHSQMQSNCLEVCKERKWTGLVFVDNDTKEFKCVCDTFLQKACKELYK